MVAPRLRSRKRKRVSVRMPSGKSIIVYKERRKGKLTCKCGRDILGTSSKKQRLPMRGMNMLCSICSREAIIKKAQSLVLTQEKQDV